MQEALTLFDSICNSRWFVRTSIILFLNKIVSRASRSAAKAHTIILLTPLSLLTLTQDLFREKLLVSPLSDYFSDFQSPPPNAHPDDVYNAASEYIVQRFVSLNQSPTKTIYTHFTCATDTQQIKFVLSAVNDIIITLNLRSCGLL